MSEDNELKFHPHSPSLNVSSDRINYEYQRTTSAYATVKLYVSNEEFYALVGREEHPVRLVVNGELVFHAKIKELDKPAASPWIRLTLDKVQPISQ